jgi:hypothetical protein
VNSSVGDLGRRVSERRQELGLSVEELARRAGMDPTYVRSLETSPSPEITRMALWRRDSPMRHDGPFSPFSTPRPAEK